MPVNATFEPQSNGEVYSPSSVSEWAYPRFPLQDCDYRRRRMDEREDCQAQRYDG